MAANVTEANDVTFQSEVLDSKEPVVVDFWAPWCAPCRALAPIVEQVAAEYSGRVKFVKLDVEQNQKTGMQYRVQSIPLLLFFKDGQRVGELLGLKQKPAIEQKLQELFGSLQESA